MPSPLHVNLRKKQNLQELNSLAAGPGQPVEGEAAGNGRAGGKFMMMVCRREFYLFVCLFRAQELCESRGSRPGLPAPNRSLYGQEAWKEEALDDVP